ncbi:hypothetical protein CO709_19630 [Burkholderia thailandensis]|nr:hypothetical protein CO709_19630 [Burkholderia thailandensis]
MRSLIRALRSGSRGIVSDRAQTLAPYAFFCAGGEKARDEKRVPVQIGKPPSRSSTHEIARFAFGLTLGCF